MKKTGQKSAPDFFLLSITVLLVLIGIGTVYSSSYIYAEKLTGHSTYFFVRHLATLGLGLLIFLAGYLLDPQRILKTYKILIILSILFLVIVLIPGIGKKVSGARRWISLGVFKMQPSEFAKLAVIVYLSMVLPLKNDKLKLFTKGILPPLLFIGIIVFLTMLEPDVSSSGLLMLIAFFLFYIAGIPLLHIATIAVLSIPFVIILLETKQYVVDRILALNPWADPYGKGYHLIQSFRSFNLGGFFGVGPGNSTQKISNLPEAHTDFVFSVIGEETGFIGCLFITLLFILFLVRGSRIAKNIDDPSLSLLAFGLTITVSFQALFHILVVTGLAPTTGIPLPFISYGRTSLLINLFMTGMLIALSRKQSKEKHYAS